MLQRVLGDLLKTEGVDQTLLFHRHNGLISSVVEEGFMPPVERLMGLIDKAESSCGVSGLGEFFEFWLESEEKIMINRIDNLHYIILLGFSGKIARWRHAIDHNRSILKSLNLR